MWAWRSHQFDFVSEYAGAMAGLQDHSSGDLMEVSNLDADQKRFRIAENLGDKKCLVMRNHGFLTVGETAGEAFMNMYYLIRMCQVALQAEASGLELDPADPSLWALSRKQYGAFSPGKYEWPALLRRCDRLDPSYKH